MSEFCAPPPMETPHLPAAEPDWPTLVSDLRARGLSQLQIAEHVGVSQSWISRLGRRKTAMKWVNGDRLLKLHRRVREGGAPAPGR